MDFAQIASVNQPAPIRNKVEIVIIINIVIINIVFGISLNWIYPCFKSGVRRSNACHENNLCWFIFANWGLLQASSLSGPDHDDFVGNYENDDDDNGKGEDDNEEEEEEVKFSDKAVSGRRRCYCSLLLMLC